MGQTIFWNHFGMVKTPMQCDVTTLCLDLYLSVLEMFLNVTSKRICATREV